MPYEVINRLKQPSVIRVVDGTATVNLGDLSANTNRENVYAAIITSIKWSIPTGGTLKITRDAGGGPNLIANLSYGDYWSHDELNWANTPTGNIQIAIVGGGTCLLGVRKEATYNVDTLTL